MSMFRLKSCHKNWRESINFQAVTPAPRSVRVRVIDNKYQISTTWSVLYVNNTTQWHFSAFFAGNIDNVLFIPLYKNPKYKISKQKQTKCFYHLVRTHFLKLIKYEVPCYFPVPRSPCCWLSTGLTAAINAIIFTKKKIICQQLILILGWWRERQKYLEDINVVTYHHHRVVTVRTQAACTGSKDTVNIATLYYLFCAFFLSFITSSSCIFYINFLAYFPLICWMLKSLTLLLTVEVCLYLLSVGIRI